MTKNIIIMILGILMIVLCRAVEAEPALYIMGAAVMLVGALPVFYSMSCESKTNARRRRAKRREMRRSDISTLSAYHSAH